MIRIEISSRFKKEHKKFIKNNTARKKAVASALRLLLSNPLHPSLHKEKLKGSNYWSMRIDLANRIFFIFTEKNSILLIDIGPHDRYKKYS